MSASSESAEQFVRLVLDETEFALKITGSAVKNIVAALYVVSKDTSNKRGRASLSKMLKSEQELKIFSINKSDMKVFASEAKNYGVLYCMLNKKGQDTIDGKIDIMVPASDAPKVNRIIERFNLDTVDKAKIESSIEREIETQENPKDLAENVPDKGFEMQDIDDSVIDDIFSKPIQKDEVQIPLASQTEKDYPLDDFSSSKNNLEGTTKNPEKKSVRKELKDIAEEQKAKEKSNENQKDKKVDVKEPIQETENKKTVKNERGK